MTPLDLAAIEKAAKESAIGAWRYRVKINDTWRPWDATVVSTNPATWSRPAFWQDVESESLFPDQSATILALCERIREPAKVKPLVWRVPNPDVPRDPDAEDTALCADGLGGVYAISKKQKVGPERLLWWAHDPFDWSGYKSMDEAKAAAQADYDSRIRSALITETDNG